MGNETAVRFREEGIDVVKWLEAPVSGGVEERVIDSVDWEDVEAEEYVVDITSASPIFEDGEFVGVEIVFRGDDAGAFWEAVEAETGIKHRDGDVILNGNVSAKENLVRFVGFLIDTGRVTEDSLPIKAGWRRYLINGEPLDSEGKEMYAPVEVRDGFHVETKFPARRFETGSASWPDW